jgi:hypothetical protein
MKRIIGETVYLFIVGYSMYRIGYGASMKDIEVERGGKFYAMEGEMYLCQKVQK